MVGVEVVSVIADIKFVDFGDGVNRFLADCVLGKNQVGGTTLVPGITVVVLRRKGLLMAAYCCGVMGPIYVIGLIA